MTTTQNLSKLSGSVGLVTVSLTESEKHLIAAAPEMKAFIQKWIYNGHLQTFESREAMRFEGMGLLAKAEGRP